MKFPILTVFLLITISAGPYASGTAESAGTSYPSAKVYALMNPGEPSATMSQFAAKTTVDGLVYRAMWKDLEKASPGDYQWKTLDDAFDVVRTYNKRLTVHIGVSGGAWPAWLKDIPGAVTYSYDATPLIPNDSVTDPLPWNPIFLSRYNSFVTALAARIQSRGNMSLLNAISVGAPVAEMSLVGCRNNLLGGADGTDAVLYSRDSYFDAWKATIGSYRNNNPFGTATILVSAPASSICPQDNEGSAFYSTVMAANGNLAIFAADLNALGSSRVSQLDTSFRQQHAINLQTIWSATDDPTNRMAGTLQDAVCQGLGLGAGYFEIYKSDLSSSDAAIVSAIDTARTGSGCVISLTVTATAGANGTIASTNPLTVVSDATASFTLAPNSSYQPSASVSGDCPAGSWNGTVYTTGAITANCTVGFSFTKITYPLTFSATGSGAVTAVATSYGDQTCFGSCSHSYDVNTVVNLTPNPGPGCSFTGWTGDCTGTGACQVTMAAARSVTATFADIAPPDTNITSSPAGSTTSTAFTFAFSATEAGSTFECKLGSGGWWACASPFSDSISYAPCTVCRSDSQLSFAVRAKDPAGNYDPSPATWNWTINHPLSSPIDNVQDGGVVQLQAKDISSDLTFRRSIAFTLKGGYSNDYLSQTGVTTIHGVVTVTAGTVTMEKIAISR